MTERLRDLAGVDGRRLRVQAQSAVLLLHGTVETIDAREAAARVARTTAGVREVCNMLTVRHRPGAGPSPRSSFDDITTRLLDEDPTLGRFRLATASPAARAAVAVLAASLWALISIALVVLGWLAMILVSCAVVSVVVTLAYRRRSHPEHRRPDPGRPERGEPL